MSKRLVTRGHKTIRDSFDDTTKRLGEKVGFLEKRPGMKEFNEIKYNNTTSETRIIKSSRKVAKFSLEGVKLEEYPSVQIAANENACDASGISKVCRGKKKTCGGFMWKYID